MTYFILYEALYCDALYKIRDHFRNLFNLLFLEAIALKSLIELLDVDFLLFSKSEGVF